MLSREQVEFYKDHGFLHIPAVFSDTETDELATELDWLMETWSVTDAGWIGPWRKAYMDAATEEKSKLTAMHDLQFYSNAWNRAVHNPRLVAAMVQLLGPNVELHHSTMHIKPPETGHPFPMHQDNAFYEHPDNRYIDVLVHLDDTCHENGEIRVLDGSYKNGPLPHITETPDGLCTPHLPTDEFSLADTVAVPAKRGDVVCFNIYAVHGSHINQTDRMRRLVRIGYRDPGNLQTAGQSIGRPGMMVAGRRPRAASREAFSTEAVAATEAP